MTLNAYNPEQLDQFALRLLDLAGMIREMARRARDAEVQSLALNDRKAQEWYGKLERWVLKAQAELDGEIRVARAERRAQLTPEA